MYWPSGTVDVLKGVATNQVLEVTESLGTGLTELPSDSFTASPNPARDQVTITGNLSGATALVLDGAGRVALRQNVANGRLDVSALTPGAYVLQVLTPTGTWKERLVKL